MELKITTDTPLPELRQDLQIMEGTRQIDGSRSWVIFDPLRHQYFQIGQRDVRILDLWRDQPAGDVVDMLAADGVQLEHLQDLLRFLYTHSLTLTPFGEDARSYAQQAKAASPSWAKWAIHNYLFIRIPLVRPHAFLSRTLEYTEVFFTRTWWLIVGLIGLTGLYFASRQWDEFVHTFLHFFSPEGLVLYALALVCVKILHELGHAYAATRFGCRVTTMGVAFLVLFPVLYTDTTDSWKLTSKRQRLIIAGAGVATELTIAAMATFMWAFLPDGPWRSVAFFVATTSWVMSLTINLNPLMRFDGYYFLSDLIGVQNLQARSFALGRWSLREFLFDLRDTVPEALSAQKRRFLIGFAWATWIYRFFLFLGIALLIYNIFFKALGIILFIIEILWFIVFPIFSEFKEWWTRRQAIIHKSRARITASLAVILVVFFVIPWQSTIRVPAVLEATELATIYAHESGQIQTVHVQHGDYVSQGDVLIEVTSPDLTYQTQQAKRRIDLIRSRLGRVMVDAQDLDQKIVLQRELQRALKTLKGLEAKAAKLNVVAPASGLVRDLQPALHAARWINPSLPLLNIVSEKSARVRGYVAAESVARLPQGAPATFIPDGHEWPKMQAVVQLVADTNADAISLAALASRYNGPIAVSETTDTLEPLKAWYGLVATLSDQHVLPTQTLRGQLHAEGRPESFAAKAWRQIVRVLIRESGF